MKKGIMIFIAGFAGGLFVFLKWIMKKFPAARHAFKLELIEEFEHLILGYNTVKGPRKGYYQPYYRRYPYSGYRTTYRDYYGDKSFEDDEKEDKNAT